MESYKGESDMSLSSGSSPDVYYNSVDKFTDSFFYPKSLLLPDPEPLRNFTHDYETGSIDSYESDMNFYQDNYQFSNGDEEANFNSRSMLGDNSGPVNSEEKEFDPDYELEVLKTLDALEEEIHQEDVDKKPEKKIFSFVDRKEQYEDYYDDFPDEDEIEAPTWYHAVLDKKIKIAKGRLTDLSKLICYTSEEAKKHIYRMEADHNAPLCKFDTPWHPVFSREWTNYWKFNCTVKCTASEINHVHTRDCEKLVLEHFPSGTTTESKNILNIEFPGYVMNAVETFQDFVESTNRKIKSEFHVQKKYNCEKPTWFWMKLRSNYKQELLMVLCVQGLDNKLIYDLKNWYKEGIGRSTNVVSVYCVTKGTGKKVSAPKFMAGPVLQLRDKIGPIITQYSPQTNVNFNSIDTQLLAKTLLEYLNITQETTVLDIGCNIGVITLILAQRAFTVYGLNTLDHEVKIADDIKKLNNIKKATFLTCKPNEIESKCSAMLQSCMSVAVLHLAPPYGKCNDVMRALRNLPTIWQVAVYGPITTDFHKYITVLTTHDGDLSEMGDEFIPKRCCILDKAPVEENLDILILFERPSLIQPKILPPGPMLNLKVEDTHVKTETNSNETFEIKGPILKVEKGFGGEKSYVPKSFGPKSVRPGKKFGKFDSPLLPKDTEKDVSNKESAVINKTPPPPPPPPIDDDDDAPYVPLPLKIKKKENVISGPSIISTSTCDKSLDIDRILKKRSKRFDCPSPPRKSNQPSPPRKFDHPSPPRRFDHPSPPRRFDHPSPPRRFDHPSPPRRFDHPSPPRRFDHPSPPRRFDHSSPPRRFDHPSPPRRSIKISDRMCDRTIKEERIERSSSIESTRHRRRSSRNENDDLIFDKPIKEERLDRSSSDESTRNSKHSSRNEINDRIFERPIKEERIERSLSVDSTKHSHSSRKMREKEIFLAQPEINGSQLIKSIKKEKVDKQYDVPNFSVKIEKDVITNRTSYDSEKEEGEISPESDSRKSPTPPLVVTVKTEPMDYSDNPDNIYSNIVNNVPIKTEKRSPESYTMSQSIKIKTEPVDDIVEPSEPIKIKNEPLSPSHIDDLETMETPKHRPIAFENPSSIVCESNTNYTVDGNQYSVNPNKSFLNSNLKETNDPKINEVAETHTPLVKIKLEKNYAEQQPNDKSGDEDVSIIQEKLSTQVKVKKERHSKYEDGDDLRKLLEKQRALQRQLAHSDFAIKQERRSPSSGRYSSSSEKRYRRSTPPYSPRTRIIPSFSRSKFSRSRSRSRSRSPSPRFRRQSPYSYSNNRFSSRYRTRSPIMNDHRSRSPYSPGRSRSPYSYRRRSRSPYFARRRSPPPRERDGRYPVPYSQRSRSPIRGFRESPPFDISKYNKKKYSPTRFSWRKNSRSRSRSFSPKRIKLERRTPERCDSNRSSSLSLSPPPATYREKRDKKKEHQSHKKTIIPEKTKIRSSTKKKHKSDSGSSANSQWDIPRLGNVKKEKIEVDPKSPVRSTSSNTPNHVEKEIK